MPCLHVPLQAHQGMAFASGGPAKPRPQLRLPLWCALPLLYEPLQYWHSIDAAARSAHHLHWRPCRIIRAQQLHCRRCEQTL